MQSKVILVLIVSLVFAVNLLDAAPGKQWVLLVAGSNTYVNYRHQSDVYHAYQIFAKTAIPKSQIIVMHYDDIANNDQNPTPGTVINQPNGPNNYVGVPKDYTGDDVTPENFLKILSGQDMGPGKKTVKSGPEDRIFVYFADHGAPHLIAFPNGNVLHAADLIDVIKQMHGNNQYREIVFYIEACESGSMFSGLLQDEWNVYATTAANPFESSYACYYSEKYNTYLADCYSAEVLTDIDSKVGSWGQITFHDQYLTVKAQVTTSHVCQYGSKNIALEPLSNFFNKTVPSDYAFEKSLPTYKAAKLSSRDIVEEYLMRMSLKSEDFKRQFDEFKLEQKRADVIFGSFSHSLELHKVRAKNEERSNDDSCHGVPTDIKCMKSAVNSLTEHCGPLREASYHYAAYLRDACTVSSPGTIAQKLKDICSVIKL